jgi:diguanylate cyclase (GGDEF)-like protein
MEDRLGGLLEVRMKHLKLPQDIAAAFWNANAKTERKIATAWCRAVGLLNIPSGFFDFGVIPAGQLSRVITFRCLITMIFLSSAQYIQWRKRHTGLCVMLSAAALVLMAGIDSSQMESNDLFNFHLNMGITISATAIILVPLETAESALLTASTMVVLVGVLCVAPVNSWVEKAQMLTFYGSVMAALLQARYIQNRYQWRLFLLQAREELRAGQMTERNAQLSSIAYVDSLTKISNRRYFDEYTQTVNRSPELYSPLTVCMIDIDHFKNLNDRLGHPQGDRCLAAVAGAIRDTLRAKEDVVARYGGEEFVLMLPRTAIAQAMEVANRVRMAVLQLQLENPGTALGRVTVSIGVAAMEGQTSLSAALLAADEALYRAKQQGRNCVNA